MEKEIFDFEQLPLCEDPITKSSYYSKKILILAKFDGQDFNPATIYSILKQTYTNYIFIIYSEKKNVKLIKDRLNKLNIVDDRIKIINQASIKQDNTFDYILFYNFNSILHNTYIETSLFSLESNSEYDAVTTDYIDYDNKKKYCYKKFTDYADFILNNDIVFFTKSKNIKDTFDYRNNYSIINFIKDNYNILNLRFYGVWYLNLPERKTIGVINKYKKTLYKMNVLNFPVSTSEYFYEPKEYKGERKKSENKKNILCIAPWAVYGGADIFNYNIINRLKSEGYNIIFITTEIKNYQMRQKIELQVNEYFDLTTFIPMDKWAEFIDYIIKVRNINLIFQMNSLYFYYAIPWIKSINPNVPIIDYIHAEDYAWRNGGFPLDSSALSIFLDKTYASSNHLKNIMYDKMNRKNKNVEVKYIGTDTNYFDPKQIIIKDEKIIEDCKGKKVILFPSRISFEKRPLFFVELAKNILSERNDYIFLIIGDGQLSKVVNKKIKENKLQNNILTLGLKTDMREYYKISDLTLICSLSEGITLTTYESLSMGTPVISSNVGGQHEIINDKNGKIIKTFQDPKSDLSNFNYSSEEINLYKEAIYELTDKNNDYNKEKIRKQAINKFSLDDTIDQICEDIKNQIACKKQNNSNPDYIDIFKKMVTLNVETNKYSVHGLMTYPNTMSRQLKKTVKSLLRRK